MWNKIFGCIRKIDMKIYSFFTRHSLKKCGKKVFFNGKLTIVEPKNLEIGNNCSFNHYIYINATNPIKIGNDVTISARASIVSTGINYLEWFATSQKKHTRNEGLIIGDHVWIGTGAVLLENASITGHHVVVAANAVVTKKISDSYCVVGGCPAKVIKRIDPSAFQND